MGPGSSGVEQGIENPRVGGSNPPPGTITSIWHPKCAVVVRGHGQMQRRVFQRSPSKARTGDIDMFAIDMCAARNHRYAFVIAYCHHGRNIGSGAHERAFWYRRLCLLRLRSASTCP